MAKIGDTIDLTLEPKDHLTTLPSELLHIIIGYLFPSHEPELDRQLEEISRPDSKQDNKQASYSLDFLAATCRTLRAEVNTWARVFLTQHGDITKYKPFKTAKLQSQRNFLRGRGGLLTWAGKHCVFCGKASNRHAILMNGLCCCSVCDKNQWPDKITKTDAKNRYDLKDHHLLPHHHSAGKLLVKHPGLPKVRYGIYISSNVETTMFLKKDVEALAELAHGDLKAHLEKRQTEREERKRRMKATKARNAEEAANMDAEWARLALVDAERRKDEAKAESIVAEGFDLGTSATTPIVLDHGEEETAWLNDDLKMFMEDGEFQGGVRVSDSFRVLLE